MVQTGGMRNGAINLLVLPPSLSTFGIGFQPSFLPTAFPLQLIAQAFVDWASQNGGTVSVINRADGFMDFASIGADPSKMKRSKTGFCPTENKNVLQYAIDGNVVHEAQTEEDGSFELIPSSDGPNTVFEETVMNTSMTDVFAPALIPPPSLISSL